MNRHTSSQFDQELEEIRTKILRMGGQVEEMIKGALVGFATANREQLNGVLSIEAEVNSAEMEIDEICNKVIAKRQPTASDLRFLVACLKMIRDLERAGDEAEKMARMALRSSNRLYGHVHSCHVYVASVTRCLCPRRRINAYQCD
jgi:phosphate transport system protein